MTIDEFDKLMDRYKFLAQALLDPNSNLSVEKEIDTEMRTIRLQIFMALA